MVAAQVQSSRLWGWTASNLEAGWCRKERLERIKALRWQQRRLPDYIEPLLSPSELEVGALNIA